MKILVVDDDFEVRDLIKEVIVGYLGATVVMGVNGQDGWREFQESRPDLVITDLRMETEDAGFELARKIKEVSPVTPVIMITAVPQMEAAGVVDYLLPKPFQNVALVEKIKEFLERR